MTVSQNLNSCFNLLKVSSVFHPKQYGLTLKATEKDKIGSEKS